MSRRARESFLRSQFVRWAGRLSVSVLAALAVTGAIIVHRRLPWVPLPYLLALILLPFSGWRIARWRTAPRRLRWSAPILAALSVVALCPVPWLKADLEHPPGSAWRLDGRVEINGVTVDPPGTWYWLTVGRPPIVAEVVKGWLLAEAGQPASMRQGRLVQRPAFSEPAAAAVGLRRAGWPVEVTMVIEVSGPLDDRLPERAELAALNGRPVSTRDEWDSALRRLGDVNTAMTISGDEFGFDGPTLPFARIDLLEVPDDGLRAVVGGRLARTLPGTWFRDLALGASHGLMVALVAYVHGSGDDLAMGRAVAGTGRISSDGSVDTVGGLVAKATAARDVGADVMLFPAAQARQLASFEAGSMQLIPVASLDEAIAALQTAMR
jgi:Lon protease (S16) C-terminal proteolytic domain